MAIEQLASGYDAGWQWNIDHDEVAGTIGTTVTGDNPPPGVLNVTCQVIRSSNGAVVQTIGPVELTQFLGLGRQVLYTNPVLVGVVMVQPKGTVAAFTLNIWSTFNRS